MSGLSLAIISFALIPQPETIVEHAVASPLAAWEAFYVIVGSSAGALTGLQFVVVALSAESSAVRRTELSMLAFGSPTIVHFCAVLLIAGILSTPWTSLGAPGLVLAVSGAAGIGYTGIVIRRALQPGNYEPVFEDWLWHAAFPAIAYAGLFVAGVVLPDSAHGSLLVIGGVSLLLLFSGIHNAWDAATYIALARAGAENAPAATPAPPPSPVPPAGAGTEP